MTLKLGNAYSADNPPTVVRKSPLEVTPLQHGIWCTREGYCDADGKLKLHVNDIISRRPSEDGKGIWFMLESHNFHYANFGEPMEVVEVAPMYGDDEVVKRKLAQDRKVMGLDAQS